MGPAAPTQQDPGSGQGSAPAAEPALDWASVFARIDQAPAELLAQALAKRPEVRDQAVRTVRHATIEERARQAASKMLDEGQAALSAEVKMLREKVLELTSRDEARLKESLTPEEWESHVKDKRLEEAEARRQLAEAELRQTQDDRLREQIYAFAADPVDGFGFGEGEIKELAAPLADGTAPDGAVLKARIIKIQKEREKRMKTESESAIKALRDDLEAFKAQIKGGTSAFVETAGPAPSGGALTFDALEEAWLREPDKYNAQYREARRKRGI